MSRSLPLAALALLVSPAWGDEWPMWGGRPDRNMVSSERNLPLKFSKDTNLKWAAKLGAQTFGNPVVSGGRVFIGTNNGQPRNPAIKGDKGVFMCFSAKDGSFLWQAVYDKLPGGQATDFPNIGLTSTPCVVGDRVYYVSNRCELVSADVEGFADGENDGPLKDEKATGKKDVDVVWSLDMMKELGVVPNQAASSSPLVVGELVFVLTGQGADFETGDVKNPKAPSFIAVNRTSGKVVWQDSSPGDRILEGQWGSPAYGVVDGKPQVAFPGGDGWLYAFEPETGKLIWKFNCKAHEKPGDEEHAGNQLIATPVYAAHRVLIATGVNPEEGNEEGCLRAIDARKTGDVTKTAELWRVEGEDFGGSISNVAIRDGLAYAVQIAGFLDCYDLETGNRVWQHDFLASVWGSPVIAEGRIYVRTHEGDVIVLEEGRTRKVLATNTLPGLSSGTVSISDGVLYVAGNTKLYAVAKED